MDNIKVNGYTLDNYQMEAVKAMNDAVVVVAGAGSGKTLTIQGKIKYLTENLGYKENEILCLSFTNKSVLDLKEKININIDIYTFHKLSIKLLENDKYTLINNNYLDYIINEYFYYYSLNKNKFTNLLKRYLYTNKNIYKILNSKEFIKLKEQIKHFIILAKSNNLNIKDLINKYHFSYFNNLIIINFIIEIYYIYNSELKSSNQIDLDDLIIYATKKIKELKLRYKYIIIDEFQDTSIIRLNLVLEIIKYTHAKLMVVGDDYQSIYRFNGCKIDIFLSLKRYINDTKYYYLKYTYRNSCELIYVSVSFIMKNKYQLKKEIISNKHENKPIKIVINKKLEDILKIIPDCLILGRNNKDIENINYNNKMTIHKSKGLEYERVILVNSDSIPSRINNNYLFRKIIKKDEFIYAEERRLFYVALTRTKKDIFILVNKKMSPFVKELIKNYKNYIEII